MPENTLLWLSDCLYCRHSPLFVYGVCAKLKCPGYFERAFIQKATLGLVDGSAYHA